MSISKHLTKRSDDKRMKQPKLICPDGLSARELRKGMRLNQLPFWSRVGVMQPAGSRYECGGDMPVQIAWLLHIAYGTPAQAEALVTWLRDREIQK